MQPVPEQTGEKQDTRFKPGQSGNPAGRPKGARSKLGEAFIDALLEDFQKHGVKSISDMRDEKPADYVKVIASILPKEVGGLDGGPIEHSVTKASDLGDDELAAIASAKQA